MASIEACADLCKNDYNCQSFEYSLSAQICAQHTSAVPDAGVHEDCEFLTLPLLVSGVTSSKNPVLFCTDSFCSRQCPPRYTFEVNNDTAIEACSATKELTIGRSSSNTVKKNYNNLEGWRCPTQVTSVNWANKDTIPILSSTTFQVHTLSHTVTLT